VSPLKGPVAAKRDMRWKSARVVVEKKRRRRAVRVRNIVMFEVFWLDVWVCVPGRLGYGERNAGMEVGLDLNTSRALVVL
jgi:hypothetical protein